MLYLCCIRKGCWADSRPSVSESRSCPFYATTDMRLLSALLPWMPLVAFHLLFGIRHVVWAALLALVGTAGNLLLNAYHFRARATKIFPKVSGVGTRPLTLQARSGSTSRARRGWRFDVRCFGPLQLLDLGFLTTWLVVLGFTLLTPPRINQVRSSGSSRLTERPPEIIRGP